MCAIELSFNRNEKPVVDAIESVNVATAFVAKITFSVTVVFSTFTVAELSA